MTFELAEHLKKRFSELNIHTYAEASERTGVSADYISKILRGIRVPEDEIIVKLARGLGLGEGELLMLAKKDKAPNRLKHYFERPRPKFFHFQAGHRIRWIGDIPFLLEIDPQLIKDAQKNHLEWNFEEISYGDKIALKCLIKNKDKIVETEEIDVNKHANRLMVEPELKIEDIEIMIDFLRQKGKQICRAQTLDRALRKALSMEQSYDPLIEKQILLAAALSKKLTLKPFSWQKEMKSKGKTVANDLVPIISYADAGEGFDYTDQSYPPGVADDYIARPVDLRDPSAYALRVKGDSMSPKLDEDDIIIVSPQKEARSNNIAVVRTIKGDVYLKKITFAEDALLLQSINPSYPPMSIKYKEVKFVHPVIWIKPKES